MHAFREHGRAHPRILYWFRTPPNVRVGRAALDEDAIRAIEEHHPGVAFDWTRMLRTAPPAQEAPRPDRRGRDRRARAKPGRSARQPSQAPSRPPAPPVVARDESASGWVADENEGLELPAEEAGAAARAEGPSAGRHVEERLGREGVDRLRARFAELLARIAQRVTDPARLEELRSQAERLNPDTWVTEEEARRGIAGFDREYDGLREQLGGRRRRRRGGARRRRAREARLEAGKGGETPGPDGSQGGEPAE